MQHLTRTLPIVAVLSCLSCATPATQTAPPRLGITGELSAAASDERAASAVDTRAVKDDAVLDCDPIVEQPDAMPTTCWVESRPSSDGASDRALADELDYFAALHREKAKGLSNAETRACADVSERDAARSPFTPAAHIVSVDVVRSLPGPDGQSHVLGARVRFHHVGGLRASQLQAIVDCRIAVDAALGIESPLVSRSPLATPGVRATVVDAPHG